MGAIDRNDTRDQDRYANVHAASKRMLDAVRCTGPRSQGRVRRLRPHHTDLLSPRLPGADAVPPQCALPCPRSGRNDGGVPAVPPLRPLRAASDVGLDTVTALVRIIEDAPAKMLDLKTLAANAGYSPSLFQRHFMTIVGLSPRAYHAAVRAKIYRRALKEELNATAALTHAGSG